MKRMEQEDGSEEMSDGMCLFVLLNSLSIQVFPSTLISILASFGAGNIGLIVGCVFVSSFVTFCVVMGIGKMVFKG